MTMALRRLVLALAWLAQRSVAVHPMDKLERALKQRWEKRPAGPEWLRLSLPPLRTAFVDDEWADARGACAIRFAHAEAAPQLVIRLVGVGSRDVATQAIDTLSAAFVRAGATNQSVTTFVDMTAAVACSRGGLRRCLRFAHDHGAALDKVAVVGRGFSLHYVRLLVRVARFRNVRVFGEREEAERWLLEDEAATR